MAEALTKEQLTQELRTLRQQVQDIAVNAAPASSVVDLLNVVIIMVTGNDDDTRARVARGILEYCNTYKVSISRKQRDDLEGIAKG